MEERIPLHEEGLEYWKMVEEAPLLINYNNPGFRFFILTVICFVGGGVMSLIWGSQVLAVSAILGAIGLGGLFKSLYFWLGEKRIGALLAEISTEHIAVGCPFHRIIIPWTAVNQNCENLPINNDYMAIPIHDQALNQIQHHTAEQRVPWDRKPYKCFIVTIKHNPKASWIEIYANPNEFFVNLLGLIYPMISVLPQRGDRKAA